MRKIVNIDNMQFGLMYKNLNNVVSDVLFSFQMNTHVHSCYVGCIFKFVFCAINDFELN